MKYYNNTMQRLLLLLTLFLFGCSTIAGGTVVFIVGKYSQMMEQKTRRYKRINDCFIEGRPEAFMLAESLAHGGSVSRNSGFILNPEKQDKDPDLPHHLAYAFYVVAERIGDMRAPARKNWLKTYMEPKEAGDIERFVNKKYFQSYLTKCFAVPKQFREYRSTLDKIKGRVF